VKRTPWSTDSPSSWLTALLGIGGASPSFSGRSPSLGSRKSLRSDWRSDLPMRSIHPLGFQRSKGTAGFSGVISIGMSLRDTSPCAPAASCTATAAEVSPRRWSAMPCTTITATRSGE
jgi:hypothetical protein